MSGLGSEVFLEVARDVLSQAGLVRFRARGKSMQPTICDGEAVIVEPVGPRGVKVGDIVLCCAGGALRAHRVVKRCRQAAGGVLFILRGDSSATLDAPVTADQIAGKVVAVERGGRLISVRGPRAEISRWWRRWRSRLRRAWREF